MISFSFLKKCIRLFLISCRWPWRRKCWPNLKETEQLDRSVVTLSFFVSCSSVKLFWPFLIFSCALSTVYETLLWSDLPNPLFFLLDDWASDNSSSSWREPIRAHSRFVTLKMKALIYQSVTKGFLSQETALAPCAKQDKNKTSWKKQDLKQEKKKQLLTKNCILDVQG